MIVSDETCRRTAALPLSAILPYRTHCLTVTGKVTVRFINPADADPSGLSLPAAPAHCRRLAIE